MCSECTVTKHDYYQDKPTGEFGLEYTASLIRAARNEKPNTLLFDNGDLIQGNPLGDYVARVNPLKAGQQQPAASAAYAEGRRARAWRVRRTLRSRCTSNS